MEKEIGQSRPSWVVRRVGRSSFLASQVAAGAALLLAALAACGSDDAAPALTTETGSQSPASDPASMPGTMAPASPAPGDDQGATDPSNPAPSASEGGGNEMIPLEPGAMGGEAGGEASTDMPPAEEPSAEEPPAEEPPAEEPPPEPAAFNPCPTDGSACRIMPLGDSITDGIGSSGGGYRVELFRQAVLAGHEITFVGRQANGPGNGNIEGQTFPRNHEGYSGATIATGMNQLANRVDAALAANPPDIVLLHIGTNNIYQGMPANLPDQLGALLDQITSGAPDALVVVAQITPVAESGAQLTFPNNGVDEYNAAIVGVVQERVDAGQHLQLVDMNSALEAASPNFVTLLAEGLHPNDNGYAVMARTWYDAIESVLP